MYLIQFIFLKSIRAILLFPFRFCGLYAILREGKVNEMSAHRFWVCKSKYMTLRHYIVC